MAVLIPDVPKSCPNSERYFYERLGRDLPDHWIVLHSLGLSNHNTKIWGEADFVILSDQGVFALELKGGAVKCVDGTWTFSGDFQSYTKHESPWSQAMGAMAAVRNRLCETSSIFRDVLFGYGVVMPYTTFTYSGSEIVSEILLDQRTFKSPLNQYINSLAAYWRQEYISKRGKMYSGLSRRQLHEARQILRPDLETAVSLGGYLTGLDEQLVQLTHEQILASRRMAANPRTVIRGSAGTGKSIIALARARQLGKDGRKVLYVCYNRLLAMHVKYGLEEYQDQNEFVQVYNVHTLYREIIESAGHLPRLLELENDSTDYFGKQFPEIAVEALCEKSFAHWDVLVIDEAQDLLTPEHLDVFDLLLEHGLSRGSWHMFLDPRQNIYGDENLSEIENRLLAYFPTFDDLFVNCRNTRQVAVQTSIISGLDNLGTNAPDGPECEIHYYSNKNEAVEILEHIIVSLISSEVQLEDIAILSTRKHKNSLLSRHRELGGFQLIDPAKEDLANKKGLLNTTMHAFKGLDRKVVIAIDMAEVGNEKWSMLHYIGLSRARVLLHILLPKPSEAAYKRQAKSFGERLQRLSD